MTDDEPGDAASGGDRAATIADDAPGRPVPAERDDAPDRPVPAGSEGAVDASALAGDGADAVLGGDSTGGAAAEPAGSLDGEEPGVSSPAEALGSLFTNQLLAKTAAGFAVAALLVYLLGWGVGWGRILTTLSGARLRWLGAACLSTVVGLAAWGKAWQVVLGVAGVEESYRRLVVTYFAATFANYVTPLGQAGGEPFVAYVLAADTDASYEDSLASVVTADLLNLLPFFNFAAVGLGWLLVRASLTERAEDLAVGLVAMAVGVPLVVALGWRRREAVEAAILRLAAPVARHTGRIELAEVRRRVEAFYAALERIAAEPRALSYALAFAYVGWVFFALPLYFAGLTLEYDVGLLVVLFVVPASTLAGLVPTPGGTGAVDWALAVLLVPLTALVWHQAVALALVYRVASYYFAVLVGGLAAVWVVVRT